MASGGWRPAIFCRALGPGLLALALTLAACASTPQAGDAPSQELGGINTPEAVVESFFEDLGDALKDPDLGTRERRAYWVDRLASYFAPTERDDQRLALQEALGNFARDLEGLAPDETLTLELRGFDPVQATISPDGQRATVRLPEATIYMLITKATESGPATIYEQPIGFDRVISNPEKSVPLVRIGGRWYLTEG
ncbi:MAG TPA: hypothetical protein VNL77_17470 [Roseiflexaceae bacterium]|nr:hypothetical protein [Roseiflexaceae bacterium]